MVALQPEPGPEAPKHAVNFAIPASKKLETEHKFGYQVIGGDGWAWRPRRVGL